MSTAHYDADGRLTSDGTHSYTWSPVFTGPTAIGSNALTYDAFNRLVEAQNGSSYVEYLYSPSGARVANMNGQTYSTVAVPLPMGAIATYYGSSSPHYYAHPDWLGSIRVSSTSARVLSQDESFAPFGEEYQISGCCTTSQSGDVWTGQHRNNVVAGLWDFPMREYFNNQGRWMSPDPAGLAAVDPTNPQTWNRYAYVGGNPLSNVDPLGLGDNGGSDQCTETTDEDGNIVLNCPNGGSTTVYGDLQTLQPWLVTTNFGCMWTGTCNVPQKTAGSGAGTGGSGAGTGGEGGGSANNGPVVLKNPCSVQGRALPPSAYAAMGNNAPWYSLNFALDVHYGWRTGQYLDAQPLTSVPGTWKAAAYGNYVYGVYMQASDVPLSVALRGAEGYALTKNYPAGTPIQPGYPGLPTANAQNIINGYNAQASGTTCQATTPPPPTPGG